METRHADGDWTVSARAETLHREAVIIDGQGVALLLPAVLIPPAPLDGKTFLERAAASGVSAMNTTLGLGGIATGPDDLRALLTSIYGYLCYFELEAARVLHVLAADDVEQAKRQGKLGIIFGVQGLASKIDGDLTLLRILHRLGLRVAQLTHNERNAFGCGCLETPDDGLTQLGRACVAELNHVGILVDLAHAGPRTTREAIELASRPCVISHANARALRDNPRNVPDEVLRVLGARGGVLGISAYAPFCETKPGVRPALDDLVDHIEHVANVIGIDHVGIGSDF
jgi:membrane dipeptidase